MRKLSLIVVLIAVVIAVIAAIALNNPSTQDELFKRVANTMVGAPAPAFDGLRVVVCGSASPLGNDPARAQACIAVITPEHLFIFDIGARSPQRIAQARLPLRRLTGVFLTHYHSDHISGLPDVNLASWVQGHHTSLQVYGPPGIDRVIAGFNLAYELDRGYRVAHHGAELLPPAGHPMTPVTVQTDGIAWQDELMTIRSFPVVHDPVHPAVGYRVDYRGRSVVISGDTVAVEALFEAAAGADLVLHDALSRAMLDPMIEVAEENNVPVLPTIMTDVIDYHADTIRIEQMAADADIGQLAYYHLVPVPPNSIAERIFARGLSEDTLLVRDLHTFDMPADSTEIIIREP